MNRSNFALFVALLIHLVFLLIFIGLGSLTPSIKKVTPVEKKIKVSLRDLPLPKKQIKKSKKSVVAPQKTIEKPKIVPLMPKGKQLKKIIKKIIKKTPVVFKPKAPPKKNKLNPKLKPLIKTVIKKVPKVEPLPPQKPYIPLLKPEVKKVAKKNISEMDWLMEDKSDEIKEEDNLKKSGGASAGKNIQELYGSDFGKLSKGQQEYILNNQEIMRRITQEVLNRQASVTNINGLNVNRSNVIEFYLHPNGDMSDFKFLQKSGYFVLDDITKSTIAYAYSKYPRPTEKTLIRYNVFYNLLRR